ncbi:MAG: ArnT family glycosyltransferase, partial [Chroococcales cyanobacterium]
MALKRNHTLKTDIAILGIIWLIQAICDRIWLRLDSHIPAWDQTNHLTGSLNYLHALQNAEWFSGEWWRHLWMLSSKNPPLPYITSAPFQALFGKGPDSALMMNFVFSAILLLSVYGLGRHLFNRQVGLWAAAFCVLFPRFYTIRIQYLIDYPLAALVTASFLCLTLWRDAIPKKQQWGWAIAFGLCLGGTIMIKQSVVFFLFFPLVWLGGKTLWKRDWGRFGQLCTGLLVSTVIFFPWYSTNWIFFFGSQQVVMSAASNEGDPPLNTLAAWTYYWKDLPRAVSFPLLIVPIVAFIFAVGRSLIPANSSEKSREKRQNPLHPSLAWLLLYFAGSYLLCSALFNKDLRYILPYLPVLSVILAYGFTLIPRRWSGVQWGTVGIAFLLMTLNLFPLGRTPGIFLTQLLSPQAQLYPYTGQPYPNSDVIAEVINTTPYLEANIGVLARLPEINHNNMNYYGALADFQVYGREIGTRHSFIEQDARSLDWFLTRQNTPESQREATEKMKAQIQQT